MNKFTFFVALFLCVGIWGCEDKEDTKNDNNDIVGTWKCIGFGNEETKKVKPIWSKHCEKCYTITFKEDGIFEGKSLFNGFSGKYKVNQTSFEMTNIGGTKIGEMGDAGIFIHGIYNAQNCIFEEDSVCVYYSKTAYLLFKRSVFRIPL